jgi:hypothetical protein
MLPPPSPPVTCQFPAGDHQAILIADWALAAALRMLSLPNILTILASVLLERPVVIASSHLGVLSNTVFSFLPMIRPLIWQGLFVPILPHRMHDLLDAPVPYIFGVHSIPQRLLSRTDITLIFLDSDKIQVPPDLHPLPEVTKLRANLQASYAKVHATAASSIPSSSSRQQLLAMQEFLKILKDYLMEVTESIFRSLHRQPGYSHVFNSRLFQSHEDYKAKKQAAIAGFLKRVPVPNKNFVAAFIQTQHFFHYSDVQIKAIKKRRKEQEDKPAPAPPGDHLPAAHVASVPPPPSERPVAAGPVIPAAAPPAPAASSAPPPAAPPPQKEASSPTMALISSFFTTRTT